MAQNLEQLKQKYQTVLDVMQQEQVQLQNVNMTPAGDKLYIKGLAPSDDAKNKVWDKVKAVDASYKDLTLDLSVSQTAQPKTQTAGASAGGGQGQSYTVQQGDTLSAISEQFYGKASEYMKIFNANKDKMDSPDHVKAGTELVIPG